MDFELSEDQRAFADTAPPLAPPPPPPPPCSLPSPITCTASWPS